MTENFYDKVIDIYQITELIRRCHTTGRDI